MTSQTNQMLNNKRCSIDKKYVRTETIIHTYLISGADASGLVAGPEPIIDR